MREVQRYRERSIYDEAFKEAQSFNDYIKIESYLASIEHQLIEQEGMLNENAITWIATVRKISSSQNPLRNRLVKLNS